MQDNDEESRSETRNGIGIVDTWHQTLGILSSNFNNVTRPRESRGIAASINLSIILCYLRVPLRDSDVLITPLIANSLLQCGTVEYQ